MRNTALIAMSGGVDSSVAALLTKGLGYNISGMTLRLYCEDDIPLGSLQCELDAKSVCDKLCIPHYVADHRAEFFKTVVGNFISAYENGETPNPCVVCNRKVKFASMLEEADKLGIEKVVTGHYAKVEYDGNAGRYILKKGADSSKDQSYMLYDLTQEQLSRILFPLGELKKAEIRKIAEENGFVSADKKDSQDICFIPDGDYAGFIERITQKVYPVGDFVDTFGKVLGKHRGIIRYTTGQRKGLGLALPAPMYVLSKDVESNLVVLGRNEELFTRECFVKNINCVSVASLYKEMRAEVRVRYSHSEVPATVFPLENGRARIEFDAPVRAITRGQSAVFYKDDIVLGGGIIE